jgi:molybdopterin converting factor subunit 1
MMVLVRLFARAKDLAGIDAVRLELADGASVAQLRQGLGRQIPQLVGLLESSAIAVNDEFAEDSTALKERDEIALLPPVSGGLR